MHHKKRQILGLMLSVCLVLTFLYPQTQSYFYLQEKQRMSVGDSLNSLLNLSPNAFKSINILVKDDGNILTKEGDKQATLLKPGQVVLELKLFGLIPLKQINVDVMPSINLVPGGHSIGVLLRTEGVMVVGFSPVLNEKNEPVFPARDAGIASGDIIIEINGIKVVTDDQVKSIISTLGDSQASVQITVQRDNKLLIKEVYPQYCYDTKSYRIGLFIRDNAGGVGTLTFYDPLTKKYGALGHVISDSETNQRLHIRQGKILCASVENIQTAKRGNPGEKIGILLENSELGNIEKNEACGIYGLAFNDLTNPLYEGTIPVGYSNQLHTGKAKILTVLKGQEIESFDILIEKIMYGRTDGKNMIIKINDEELLKKTGGIVQGMSGSPIIQDGKLIGAVTHVFVNDPGRGYGVFIENMLQESGAYRFGQQTLGQSSQGLLYNCV